MSWKCCECGAVMNPSKDCCVNCTGSKVIVKNEYNEYNGLYGGCASPDDKLYEIMKEELKKRGR
jgi:hypothetical protein